jgi:hypothetical protein
VPEKPVTLSTLFKFLRRIEVVKRIVHFIYAF